MKKFKDYIKAIIVDKLPVHGLHALKRIPPILIDKLPIHGKHSQKELKENFNDYHLDDKEEYEKNKETLKNHNYNPLHRSIMKYSESSYEINHSLLNNDNYHDINHEIENIDSEIKKHKTPIDIKVYHGTGFDPDEYASKHPERHIKFPTYISTSIDHNKASEFSSYIKGKRHIIKFHIPKDYNGIYIGNKGHYDEDEFLMPRNKTFKIDKEPKIIPYRHTYFDGNSLKLIEKKYHVWDAHPIKEDE